MRAITLGFINAACFLLLTTADALALEEGITQNPDGDYVITFQSETSGQMVQWLWVPATKIDPTVASIVAQSTTPGSFTYSYIITNGATSKQDLAVVRLIASGVVSNSQIAPPDWEKSMDPDWGKSSGYIVGWSVENGVKPGSTQNEFGFSSRDLPGVGLIDMFGSAPIPALHQIAPAVADSDMDDGLSESDPVFDQFNDLHYHNFVSRIATIPRIPIPKPFDASQILSAIKNHLDTDLATLKLVDARLLSQLDRNLQNAVEAAKANDLRATKKHIDHTLRIIGSHKATTGGIDAQAATVLSFDLQYVASRL